ncbi:hypothetical protein [Azospirillum sp. sgz301742]
MTNFTQAIPLRTVEAQILKRNLLVLIQQYVSEAKSPRLSAEERDLAMIEASNLGDIVDRCDSLITRNRTKEMAG